MIVQREPPKQFTRIIGINSMSNQMNSTQKLDKLRNLHAQGKQAGGEQRIRDQHQRGKLSARERLDLLFDPGTFEELDPLMTHRATDFGLADRKILGDSVVTGYGRVGDRNVFAYSQDFTVMGGSLSQAAAQKICKMMDLALKVGSPIVGIVDSGGARIQEGVDSLAGYGEIFLRNTLASGVVPQLSVIVGPAAGGGVYSPALTDFIFMTEGLGQMYITGPDVVKASTGEEVNHEELGGANIHTAISGVAHFSAATEEECFSNVRTLLEFLPSNNSGDPPWKVSEDNPMRLSEELRDIVPDDSSKPYDMLEVILRIVDHGGLLQVHQRYAPNIIVGYARLDGWPIGVVAQQPLHLAGSLDIDASLKAARFVRTCDAFNIPILTLVDVPGYMPGTQQEYGGIIKHGAKLIYAYAEATVPKVTILTRKAYGGAYIVMGSKHLRGDINFAWPASMVAVMGPEGAVNILHRQSIQDSQNPKETHARLVEEYQEQFANPYIAASRGYLDDVIDPAESRIKVIRAMEMLRDKQDILPAKKHGNIPL
jgi:acetyl-CoA carboxylase carboxyltransferase component